MLQKKNSTLNSESIIILKLPSLSRAIMSHVYRIFVFYLLGLSVQVVNGVVIQTKGGSVNGTTGKSRGGREFLAFYGIPYAEPPVGNLRFKVGNWLNFMSIRMKNIIQGFLGVVTYHIFYSILHSYVSGSGIMVVGDTWTVCRMRKIDP